MKYEIFCVLCAKKWDEHKANTTCLDCGGALEVVMDISEISRRINRFNLKHAPLSAVKYLDFYPLKQRDKIITLNEGNTPLYAAKKLGEQYGLSRLFIKNEGANPTGVFKDRGSMVEISKAVELGAKGVCVASTGNMAASVAAYASQAGLPCFIFVPEGTPIGKLAQTLSYGGQLVQIRGSYADCVKMAEAIAHKKGFYLAGDYAFRAEGAKSIAFEIVEQLGGKSPDIVICPVGCGTNLAGIWRGFVEFHALGLIENMPRIIGVQPEGCDTICGAFLRNETRYTFVETPKTVASAVGIGVPQDDVKCLKSLRDSKGTAATATEKEILRAQKKMAQKESIFVEPSGAIPVAVLENLLKRKEIHADDTVVCIATGTGLKDPIAALGSFSEPVSVDPNVESILHFLKTGGPKIENEGRDRGEKILFTSLPNTIELKDTLKKEFEFEGNEKLRDAIFQEIRYFLGRGKHIQKSDLLDIIEEAMENESIPQNPIRLIDFRLHCELKEMPTAKVEIEYNGHNSIGQSSGVGPVDALIKALEKSVREKVFLCDFHVDIATSIESAAVKVRMEMGNESGKRVNISAVSPDIIIASLNAYIKGYNLLFGG